jgi:hypothetical protein
MEAKTSAAAAVKVLVEKLAARIISEHRQSPHKK